MLHLQLYFFLNYTLQFLTEIQPHIKFKHLYFTLEIVHNISGVNF
jgi:hypothetical protein